MFPPKASLAPELSVYLPIYKGAELFLIDVPANVVLTTSIEFKYSFILLPSQVAPMLFQPEGREYSEDIPIFPFSLHKKNINPPVSVSCRP